MKTKYILTFEIMKESEIMKASVKIIKEEIIELTASNKELSERLKCLENNFTYDSCEDSYDQVKLLKKVVEALMKETF